MAKSALIMQQQLRSLRKWPKLVLSSGDPWQWWTPQQIAQVTQAPVLNVVQVWPLLYASLELYGIADYNTCRAAIATVAIETAHTFLPVREAYWLDDRYGYEWAEDWRRRNLRYWPYYGRGLIQLTWQSNYQYYGWMIGVPNLADFPDKALTIEVSCPVFAVFFHDKGINLAAANEDWREVRRLVQGGSDGLPDLIRVVNALAV